MARSINKVILVGNVGRDPELKYTPNNVPVASFSIATNERFKDRDGNWQDRAEWHNVIAWQRTAEIASEYLKKGSKVYVEGKLQTRSWDYKQTGEKKYRTEVIVTDMVLLGGERDQQQTQRTQSNAVTNENPITDKDIPF